MYSDYYKIDLKNKIVTKKFIGWLNSLEKLLYKKNINIEKLNINFLLFYKEYNFSPKDMFEYIIEGQTL